MPIGVAMQFGMVGFDFLKLGSRSVKCGFRPTIVANERNEPVNIFVSAL